MTVMKFSVYLAEATITLWSDNLHLKQFPQTTTMNAKVNNWGIELTDYKIKFKFINEIKTHLLIPFSRQINLE